MCGFFLFVFVFLYHKQMGKTSRFCYLSSQLYVSWWLYSVTSTDWIEKRLNIEEKGIKFLFDWKQFSGRLFSDLILKEDKINVLQVE